VEKLIASTLDEIEKLRTSGPSQVNLDKFKAEDRPVLDRELKNNGFWLSYINRQLQQGSAIHQILNYDSVIRKVTPQTIQARAKEYLSGRNLMRIILMPESAKK
jgi:zinc protease